MKMFLTKVPTPIHFGRIAFQTFHFALDIETNIVSLWAILLLFKTYCQIRFYIRINKRVLNQFTRHIFLRLSFRFYFIGETHKHT